MITSNRNVFVGCHVTKEVKDAIRTYVEREGISQSEFVFKSIVATLRILEVPIARPEPDSRNVPLPFGG